VDGLCAFVFVFVEGDWELDWGAGGVCDVREVGWIGSDFGWICKSVRDSCVGDEFSAWDGVSIRARLEGRGECVDAANDDVCMLLSDGNVDGRLSECKKR